jgi:hypothetical protein
VTAGKCGSTANRSRTCPRIRRAQLLDPFHVSANTDPKGNRAIRPQDQDPDVLLHVAGETDNGIVVRGAKFETAAAYANQAFVKPTIGEWNNEILSDYAVGFLADRGAPGIKHICRSAFAGSRSPEDYPLTSRYDEIDTMIVFDDVEIPWENVFFYRHTKATAFIRATLHRYSIFPYVQRYLRFADFLEGMAGGLAADDALTAVTGRAEHIAYRQLAVIDVAGGSASYSGELALGEAADVCAPGAAAAGNLLANRGVPATMLTAFAERAGDSLGDRLIAALAAGLAAGGEVSPVRSAGLLLAESVAWPVTDLRVDWYDDPVGELAKLWQPQPQPQPQPQAQSYVRRALCPAEMAG